MHNPFDSSPHPLQFYANANSVQTEQFTGGALIKEVIKKPKSVHL